jgi:hypothetical protein
MNMKKDQRIDRRSDVSVRASGSLDKLVRQYALLWFDAISM